MWLALCHTVIQKTISVWIKSLRMPKLRLGWAGGNLRVAEL